MQNLVLALIWQTPTQGEVSVKSVSMADLQRRRHRYIQVGAADRKKNGAVIFTGAVNSIILRQIHPGGQQLSCFDDFAFVFGDQLSKFLHRLMDQRTGTGDKVARKYDPLVLPISAGFDQRFFYFL